MKKIIMLMICFLAIVGTVSAQFGTKRFYYNYKVTKFPSYYVEPQMHTYAVIINSTSRINDVFDKEVAWDLVRLNGWNKLDNPDEANLVANFTFDNIMIQEQGPVDRATKETKDGKEIVTHHYHGRVVYSIPLVATYTTRDMQGGKRGASTLVDGVAKPMEYLTKEFKSMGEAKEFLSNNRDNIIDQIIRGEIQSIIDRINSMINDEYALGVKEETACLFYLDSKKSEYYEQQEKMLENFKKVFPTIKAEESISQSTIDVIKDCINQDLEIYEKLSSLDKKQRSAKSDLARTIAWLYFAIDDVENSTRWAKIVSQEFQEKDGDKLLKKVNEMKSCFDTFKINSRHAVVY